MKMISKKDLANQLIVELELDHEPIESIIKIDGEFMWLIIENVFKTDLLPKWTNLDCVNETEEFQFILMTLQQIFDLDLKDINPAYLTMRRAEYLHLVLNALYLANNYIKSLNDNKFISSESSISSSTVESSEKLDDLQIDTSSNSSNISESKDEPEFKELVHSRKKVKQAKAFEEQLNELQDDKRLVDSLTCMKEQNFALELSYKIIDVIKVQEKSKEIKTNLNKLKMYGPSLTKQTIPEIGTRKKLNLSKKVPDKSFGRKKVMKNLIRTDSIRTVKKVHKLDLDDLLDRLSGLSTNQINKLKNSAEHQREMVDRLKLDLMERERSLQNEMLSRVEKENKLLELLQREMSLPKNSSERSVELKKAKSELRRERAELKRQLDEYYLHNLSNYKHLESEQEKELSELAKRNDELFREHLNEERKKVREYEKMGREKQKTLLDNYDNFFASQSKLMREEIWKQTKKFDVRLHVNDRSLWKLFEQSYKSRLYPKFH